jgi:hypothetical protein
MYIDFVCYYLYLFFLCLYAFVGYLYSWFLCVCVLQEEVCEKLLYSSKKILRIVVIEK